MGDTPYPLPRQTRESTVLVGDGTVGPYGPSLYKVFDTADVKVWAKASGETIFADVTGSVTVSKTDGDAFDTFSITFDDALPATTQWYHQAARVAERDLAVTRAGSIVSDQLEKELSKQATTQSELRRDVDRAFSAGIGQEGRIVSILAENHAWKADAAGNMVDAGLSVATTNSGALGQVPVKQADGSVTWQSSVPGEGDMLTSAYDPAGKGDQVLTISDILASSDLSIDLSKPASRGNVDANLVLQYAADDTALQALDISSRKAALNLANEGWWLPTSDDISAQITDGDPRYQPTSGDATGASGGWYQALSIATGHKYANQGARIIRLADRVMIGGEAVKFNGLPDGGGGKGGFLWDFLPNSTATHGWMEQQALLSVGGIYNVDGAVSVNTYLAGPGVALNVHLLHDRSGDVTAASGAWAFYIDARRDLEFGTTWGCELDVINGLPSPHTAFGPWGGNGTTALGRTTGMQISAGGGPEINGPTYTADVALLIQKNANGFYTGIAFGGLSLEPDTGSGRMHAIALAPKQAIDWWGDTVAKGILASVVSNVTDATVPQELIFQNDGLGLFCGGNRLFHIDAIADAATYINIHSGASPAIGAAGTAANISLSLRSKGAATSTYLQSDAMPTFSATGVASAVNRLDALAAAAGNAVQLRALGADTDIDLQLTPKNNGFLLTPIGSVPDFADDTSAAAGGVPIGGFYRTSSALQIRAA
jgi:hypothetical protein